MLQRFLQNKTAVFMTLIVFTVALIGILAPVLAPNDPYETNIINKFAKYSMEYPLGTDQLGRCVLSRMIYGIRPTLGLAALTMAGTIGIGAILGIMAGYFRGIVEEIIMRIVDVMLSFPSQIMVFAVVALLGVSVQNVIIANVFIKWAWYARMIRTGVLLCEDERDISRYEDDDDYEHVFRIHFSCESNGDEAKIMGAARLYASYDSFDEHWLERRQYDNGMKFPLFDRYLYYYPESKSISSSGKYIVYYCRDIKGIWCLRNRCSIRVLVDS